MLCDARGFAFYSFLFFCSRFGLMEQAAILFCAVLNSCFLPEKMPRPRREKRPRKKGETERWKFVKTKEIEEVHTALWLRDMDMAPA